MDERELARLRVVAASRDMCAQFEEGDEEAQQQASGRLAEALAEYRRRLGEGEAGNAGSPRATEGFKGASAWG